MHLDAGSLKIQEVGGGGFCLAVPRACWEAWQMKWMWGSMEGRERRRLAARNHFRDLQGN